MSTRERIVYEALVLFSKKGYSDVYVAEIASAVGIKAPSLYKHFKSKRDIFDECVKFFYRRMEYAGPPAFVCNDYLMFVFKPLFKLLLGMDNKTVNEMLPLRGKKRGRYFRFKVDKR